MSLSFNFGENEVPSGGYKYFQAETERWIEQPSWSELVKEVVKHRKVNNLPVGAQIESEIRDQMCAALPAEQCIQDDPTIPVHSHPRVTLDMATNTARILVDWFLKFGKKRVPLSQANQRGAVCVRCPCNQKLADCSNCSMKIVREIVAVIIGGQSTEHDNRLLSCTICGCELRAKVHLPIELLSKYMSKEKLMEFPSFCWLRTETGTA